MKISRFIIPILSFFLCLIFILSIGSEYAFCQAIMRVIPDTGFYLVDSKFDVDILIDTGGRNVVTAGAYIRYDTTFFRVNSIDTSESVFTMESEKIIDLISGDIRIARGSTTPGVNTSNGKIARINLTALSPTSPENYNFAFKLSQGATYESCVIVDDGLGTNILSTVYNGRFVVGGGSSLAGDFEGDCDVDGTDIAALITNLSLFTIPTFAQNFGINNCN